MKREQFISYCFITLLIFVVFQVFRIFAPFFQSIFWAAILTFGFYPLYQRLKKKVLPKNETLLAVLTTFIIFLLVVPPVVAVLVNLTTQAIDLYQAATTYIREGNLEKLIDHIRSFHFVERIENKIFEWDPIKKNASAWILNTSKGIANFTVSQVGTVTKNILFVFANVVFTIFMTFVFLKDGEKIYDFLYEIAPLEDHTKKAIFKQINESFTAVLRGQILTSLTQAIVAGIIFSILGLPGPIFFGVATFLASLIPVIGAQAIWLPLAIYLFTIHATTRGIILVIVGVLGISLIDNIMKPAIIGERTKLPYFLLFFGILGGVKLYGLVGIFLAPVILSLFFALIKIYQEKFL